jgi:hypothetical protein
MNNPVVFQRIEGAAIFLAATAVYFHSHLNWLLYVLLLFAFDIFAAGYVINTRVGAAAYNLGHSMIFPSILAVVYIFHPSDFILGWACLWFAHIGIDRALGYGLKFSSSFHDTHLGRIGK